MFVCTTMPNKSISALFAWYSRISTFDLCRIGNPKFIEIGSDTALLGHSFHQIFYMTVVFVFLATFIFITSFHGLASCMNLGIFISDF